MYFAKGDFCDLMWSYNRYSYMNRVGCYEIELVLIVAKVGDLKKDRYPVFQGPI